MAFEANARIALPELVYINLDICHNNDGDDQNTHISCNYNNRRHTQTRRYTHILLIPSPFCYPIKSQFVEFFRIEKK